MIDSADLRAVLNAGDVSTVVEIYGADQTPTAAGFDPSDAIGRYAAISGIDFLGESYTCLVDKIGSIKRTISAETNNASVTFNNLNNQISDFEFTQHFEGLIMVIRTISRSLSTTLEKSLILFTGRCEKPDSGNKMSLTVKATWILGGLDVKIPRRRYTPFDDEGRTRSDPEFEGFVDMPLEASVTYAREVKKTGIPGFFGRHKLEWETHQYSSTSDIVASQFVPEILGRAQIELTLIEGLDIGGYIRMSLAACEGPIYGYEKKDSGDLHAARSLDTRLTLDALAYAELTGLVGNANDPDVAWLSGRPYSLLAYIRAEAANSPLEDNEPAPTVVVIVLGRLMTIPDGDDWNVTDQWSDNPAAHIYWFITSPYYYKLDPNWIDEASFAESYRFNAELIIQRSVSDLTFLVEG